MRGLTGRNDRAQGGGGLLYWTRSSSGSGSGRITIETWLHVGTVRLESMGMRGMRGCAKGHREVGGRDSGLQCLFVDMAALVGWATREHGLLKKGHEGQK